MKTDEPYRSDLVDIIGQTRMTTERACLFYDGAREVWLPLSQVEVLLRSGRYATVTLPEWLAREKEMI